MRTMLLLLGLLDLVPMGIASCLLLSMLLRLRLMALLQMLLRLLLVLSPPEVDLGRHALSSPLLSCP